MKRKGFRLGLLLVAAVGVSGCLHFPRAELTGPVKRVDNVYANPYYDHSSIQNVLVLPIDDPRGGEEVTDHYHELVTSLVRGFAKFGYFNVQYDPYIGPSAASAVNLENGAVDRVKLGELGQDFNAQAALKVSIMEFRPFPPMRLHVKGILIDTATGERIWAFDEVFDSDDAETINLMRAYWNAKAAGGHEEFRFEVERLRPGYFSGYVFYTMAQSYGRVRAENRMVAEKILHCRDKATARKWVKRRRLTRG